MNRYNQIFNQQPWISSYIPLPLSEIAKAGAVKQEQYDTNKDVLNKSILDNNIKSIEEHDPYRQQYIKNFTDQAQALVDSNIDFGSHQGRSAIQNLVKQNANNPYLQTLTRSIDNKKQTLEDLEAIKKEKGAYGYWNDPFLQIDKEKSLGFNKFINSDNTPKEFPRMTINRREDHVKPVYDLFDKVKEDTDLAAWAQFSGDQTTISTGKKGWKGITPEKIMALADRNIDTFKNTEGGQDFLRKFQFDYANEISKMSPEQYQKVEDDYVKDHLYNIGSAYVSSNAIEDRGLSATSLLGKKYDEKVANKTTSTQSEALPGSLIKMDSDIEKLEFNSDGTIKPITTMEKQIIGMAGSNLKTPSGTNTLYKAKQFDMEANKKVVALVNKLQNENPELRGLKQKEVIEAYKNSVKSLSSESVPLQSISGQAAINIGDAIARNKIQRNFYLFDGNGQTEDGTLSTVLDKLDISEEDFDKALKNGIGGYTQAGPVSGGYYVDVKDEDGKSRRVVISPDEEMKSIFRTSQMVNEARKSMIPTKVNPMPGIEILVVPNITKNGNNWKYYINGEETSLDNIRKQEREVLEESNYLGSQVGILKPNTTE